MSSDSRKGALAALSAEVRGWQVDQEMFDAAVAELAGLNRTQWRCLDILSTRGPLTAGQLADASHLTTGAVTAVVDHLELLGLVRRVRDTVDRRRVFVEPTDEMNRRAATVFGPFIADTATELAAFDAGQLELITDFMRRERGLLAKHTTRLRELPPVDETREVDRPPS
jgi:DNA-binding MarR family transcriptional regulator